MDCDFGDIPIKSSAVQIIIHPNIKYVGKDKGGETSNECNANDTGKRTLQNLLLQVVPHPQKYNVRGIISCVCEASAVHTSHSSNALGGLRGRVTVIDSAGPQLLLGSCAQEVREWGRRDDRVGTSLRNACVILTKTFA